MKLFSLLLAALFATSAAAQTDSFVGTWVYNADKSPKPTITYGIKDLGGDRYALTGSSGTTTEIKADGVAIKPPSEGTVSFKKLDDHTWQMDRVDARTLKRTYTVSADNKTLQLIDNFTDPDGGREKTTTTYARTSPGKSIYGQWKSTSMEDKVSGPPDKLVIAPFGSAGLSITSSSEKSRIDMQFDGKQYSEMSSDGKKLYALSGKRTGTHVIQMTRIVEGKPVSQDELKVSDDGKTLTMVFKTIKTPAVFTTVWDKQ